MSIVNSVQFFVVSRNGISEMKCVIDQQPLLAGEVGYKLYYYSECLCILISCFKMPVDQNDVEPYIHLCCAFFLMYCCWLLFISWLVACDSMCSCNK